MESLYRKYRPLTFDSVVGQQHIVSTLEHAITEGRLSHAYLFCGPRGTGKTTMARILAKALLCRNAEAARAEGASGCMPDGTCEECELIAEGNHPDVYELDAASRTGVDNVREEIINSVNFAPVRGKYKIYIIDEVHMLTTAAFNALLKTLEEPPAHVIFVLCTTDPQDSGDHPRAASVSISIASATRISSVAWHTCASRRASITTMISAGYRGAPAPRAVCATRCPRWSS